MKRVDNVGIEPLTLKSVVTPASNSYSIDEHENRLIIRPTLALTGFKPSPNESQQELAVSIEATFAVVYICENIVQLMPENLAAFASTNAIYNLWPFWRELVMNISTRLRLHPIVIPLLRL